MGVSGALQLRSMGKSDLLPLSPVTMLDMGGKSNHRLKLTEQSPRESQGLEVGDATRFHNIRPVSVNVNVNVKLNVKFNISVKDLQSSTRYMKITTLGNRP